MIELLALVNLWCQPFEFEVETFLFCRHSLVDCLSSENHAKDSGAKPNLKNSTQLSPTLHCFKEIDKKLKKNFETDTETKTMNYVEQASPKKKEKT